MKERGGCPPCCRHPPAAHHFHGRHRTWRPVQLFGRYSPREADCNRLGCYLSIGSIPHSSRPCSRPILRPWHENTSSKTNSQPGHETAWLEVIPLPVTIICPRHRRS